MLVSNDPSGRRTDDTLSIRAHGGGALTSDVEISFEAQSASTGQIPPLFFPSENYTVSEIDNAFTDPTPLETLTPILSRGYRCVGFTSSEGPTTQTGYLMAQTRCHAAKSCLYEVSFTFKRYFSKYKPQVTADDTARNS